MPVFGTLPKCYAPATGGHHCILCNILIGSIEELFIHDISYEHRSELYKRGSKYDINNAICPICYKDGLRTMRHWSDHHASKLHQNNLKNLKRDSLQNNKKFVRPPSHVTSNSSNGYIPPHDYNHQQPSTSYSHMPINKLENSDLIARPIHKKFSETFAFADSPGEGDPPETPSSSKNKGSSQSLPSDDEDGGAISSIKKNISNIKRIDIPSRSYSPTSNNEKGNKISRTITISPPHVIVEPIEIDDLGTPKARGIKKKNDVETLPINETTPKKKKTDTPIPEETPVDQSSSKILKRKNDESSSLTTTPDPAKKRMRSSKNWTPDNDLVQYDVSTRSMIDECKSTLKILANNRQEIDNYIWAVYNSLESIIHHRYLNLYSKMDNYSNSMCKQHELAVKVVDNFISSSNNQIPKTDVPSYKVPCNITVDQIISKITDSSYDFYREYDEYHVKDWETNDLQNQPEIQRLIEKQQNNQQAMDDNPPQQVNQSHVECQQTVEKNPLPIRRIPQGESTSRNSRTTSESNNPVILDQSRIKLEQSPPSASFAQTEERCNQDDSFQQPSQSNQAVEIDYQKLAVIREALSRPEGISSSNVLEIVQKLNGLNNDNEPSTSVQSSEPVINVQRDKFAKRTNPESSLKMDDSSDSELEVHLNKSKKASKSKSSSAINERPSSSSNFPDEQASVNISSDDDNDSSTSEDKNGSSCGEFHAFHNVTTAVVDMVLVTSSSNWRLIAGSQDGTLNEINLLSKNFIRTFTKSSSSVTKLAIDANQRYLLSNFYDKTMIIFSLDDGAILHSRTLTNRVEACCANIANPDLPDSTSIFYLGLTNGDILLLNLNGMFITVLTKTRSINSNIQSGITSISICPNKNSPVMIVGSADNSITIRNPKNGSLITKIAALNHDNPPYSITPFGDQMNCIFSYSMNSFRMHDWKANKGIGVINAPGITCVAKLDKFIGIGDADGAIKVHRIIEHTISPKPVKIFFLSSKSAVTCLSAYGHTLVAGSMDGSVTVITINESVSKYKCLYGKIPCTMKFKTRLDLVNHIMNEHIKFNEKEKITQCLWRAFKCRVKFNCEQSRKSIRAHILTHIPD